MKGAPAHGPPPAHVIRVEGQDEEQLVELLADHAVRKQGHQVETMLRSFDGRLGKHTNGLEYDWRGDSLAYSTVDGGAMKMADVVDGLRRCTEITSDPREMQVDAILSPTAKEDYIKEFAKERIVSRQLFVTWLNGKNAC